MSNTKYFSGSMLDWLSLTIILSIGSDNLRTLSRPGRKEVSKRVTNMNLVVKAVLSAISESHNHHTQVTIEGEAHVGIA